MIRKRYCLVLLCAIAFSCSASEQHAWQAWREGQALLIMRHALAPGTGDPAGFQLDDCQTQRNLNAQGRAQASAWGARVQQQYSGQIQLYSSQWCRCLETAHLMAVGKVKPLPILNSFFAGRGNADEQTVALRQYFSSPKLPQPTIVITHQVNITALTGVFPQSAEGIFVTLPITSPVTVIAKTTIAAK